MTALHRLMRHEVSVGSWYCMPTGDKFEVVAMDGDANLLEIQFYDGTVDELCFDDCLLHGLQPCAEPIDSVGAYEEDSIVAGVNLQRDNWCEPQMDLIAAAVGTNMSDDLHGLPN